MFSRVAITDTSYKNNPKIEQAFIYGNDRFNSVFIKHDRSLPAQRISLLHTEYTVLHLTMRLSKHLVIFIQGDKNRTMVKDFSR